MIGYLGSFIDTVFRGYFVFYFAIYTYNSINSKTFGYISLSVKQGGNLKKANVQETNIEV